MELAAYDKLLAGEEQRLNITRPNSTSFDATNNSSGSASVHQHHHRSGRVTPSINSPSARLSVGPSSKRKRTTIDESEERSLSDFSVTSSAKGDVEITDFDAEGKFVKLFNKGDKVCLIFFSLNSKWGLSRKLVPFYIFEFDFFFPSEMFWVQIFNKNCWDWILNKKLTVFLIQIGN